jgi:hypothetical protein
MRYEDPERVPYGIREIENEEELPDWIIFQDYKNTWFSDDDFFCSRGR